jgi:signal transduction histidine kinase
VSSAARVLCATSPVVGSAAGKVEVVHRGMYTLITPAIDAQGTGRRYDREVQVPSQIRLGWDRMRRLSPDVVDVILGSFFVVAGLISTSSSTGGNPPIDYEPRDAWAYVLILASTAPYFVRRRAPLPVFVISTAALLVLSGVGYNEGVIPLMALVGAYTVGAHRPAREAIAAGGVAGFVLLVLYLGDVEGFDAGELASNAAIFGSAILVGRNVQSRRLRLEALEHGHEEAAARAAADERLRIAQEVHDVVAHSLGVIAVQAGVGLHVVDSDPDEARRALDHISTTSRSSLAEIRGLLGVIREREGAAEYAPAPSLAELPRLVADIDRAGLRVRLERDDPDDDAPPGVQLAMYRIIQEALTNALRHARATEVVVRLRSESGAMTVTVTDDGQGADTEPRGGPRGHGLVGMRERVALYGGTLEAGPDPHGGFRVVAHLPYTKDRVG